MPTKTPNTSSEKPIEDFCARDGERCTRYKEPVAINPDLFREPFLAALAIMGHATSKTDESRCAVKTVKGQEKVIAENCCRSAVVDGKPGTMTTESFIPKTTLPPLIEENL